MVSNNPPHATVELSKEQYDFLLENCETNIAHGLQYLQMVESRSTAERLVEQLEKFKDIRKLLQRAVP